MNKEKLDEHINNIMVCKKCGKEYKYLEVISYMDSCELPGDLLWIKGCKNCGGIHYDEKTA